MKQAIAVLLPTMSQTIEQDIVSGICQALEPSSYQPFFITIGYLSPESDFSESQLGMAKRLQHFDLAGIIIYGGGIGYLSSDVVMQRFFATLPNVPVVNIGSLLEGIPSVIVDNYSGMYKLAEHLIVEQHCRSIVYLDGPNCNQEAQQRGKALRQAMQDHHLNTQQLSTHALSDDQLHVLTGDMTPSKAREVIRSWLQAKPDFPDAIVCVNDLTAKGVIEELQANDIQIPEQIKVTGFDDFEYASTMRPSLSTVSYPSAECGQHAAYLILDALQGKKLLEQYAIPSQAIIRRSSGAEVNQVTPRISASEQRRTLILERDSYAQRLAVTRQLHQRSGIQKLLLQAQATLAQLSIERLYLYRYQAEADSTGHYALHFSLNPDSLPLDAATQTLPDAFFQGQQSKRYWVMSELRVNDKHHGYLFAESEAQHSDFVEFIAPQLADILDNQRLEKETKRYQKQVELSEKMAALGSLVSGVAHEVNTPVGTSLLAASHLSESVKRLNQAYQQQKLSKTKLEQFINEAVESTEIINNSCYRAAELISSFKQVAVDQSYEEERTIDLANYIEDVLRSLHHRLKTTPIELVTNLAPDIQILTYPGALAQVITNLFMNSILHGFDNGQQAGTISINLQQGQSQHLLEIMDDGKGINAKVLEHIFEPFYTTARGQGGSGLGLHIVYNILTQKLHWQLKVDSSPGCGVRYQILIPNDA